jgi:hypothetical protein
LRKYCGGERKNSLEILMELYVFSTPEYVKIYIMYTKKGLPEDDPMRLKHVA